MNPVTREFLGKLAKSCEKADISYAILGGAACIALGSTRATEDVDLVLHSNTGRDIFESIAILVQTDPGFKVGTGQFGEQTLTLDGIEIEAFDPTAWPQRPQYTEFLAEGGSVLQDVGRGVRVAVVAPPLLLREKLVTHHQRKGKKSWSDFFDISFLLAYCVGNELTLDISREGEMQEAARAGLERYLEAPDANKDAAKTVVRV